MPLLGISAGLVGIFVVGAMYVDESWSSTAAAWVNSWATIAAFVAAGAAAFFTAKTLRIETERDDRDLLQRQMAQAKDVIFWLDDDTPFGGGQSTIEVEPGESGGPTWSQEGPYEFTSVEVRVQNASSLRVFGAELGGQLTIPEGPGQPRTTTTFSRDLGTLKPVDAQANVPLVGACLDRNIAYAQRKIRGSDTEVECWLTFRDTSGLTWRRHLDGRLELWSQPN